MAEAMKLRRRGTRHMACLDVTSSDLLGLSASFQVTGRSFRCGNTYLVAGFRWCPRYQKLFNVFLCLCVSERTNESILFPFSLITFPYRMNL